MSEFFKKLKLIHNTNYEIQVKKDYFIEKLSELTEAGNTDILSGAFDALTMSNMIYKGEINSDNFKVKKRNRLFKSNMNLAVAKGHFYQSGGQLYIDLEIEGQNKFIASICIFLSFFYMLITFIIIYQGDPNYINFVPFLLVHALITFLVLYVILRVSISSLRNSLIESFQSF